MSDTPTEHCHVCGDPLVGFYYICDETMQAYCSMCFDTTPCGRGEHGEGCPTKVFDA